MKKKIVIRILWILAAILLISIVAFVFYEYQIRPGKSFSSYSVIDSSKREDTASTVYQKYKNGLIKYNRDGISVLSSAGSVLWTAAYNIQNPTVASAGNYVAVADIGGETLYVYNEKGTSTQVNILSPILQISLSEQGEIAVLMEEEDAYHIQIFNPYEAVETDRQKAEILTYIKDDGYALGIGLSKDGAKLVTSYFKVGSNQIVSTLTFYSFTGYGQTENADRIVGIFPYENQIFPKVEFLDNNTICAYGDSKLLFFSMKQKPDLLLEKDLEQRILQIASDANAVLLLLESTEVKNQDTLLAYSTSGSKLLEKEVPFECMDIGTVEGSFYAYSENECVIYLKGGRRQYLGNLPEGTQFMSRSSRADQYFLVTSQNIEEIRLTEKEVEK